MDYSYIRESFSKDYSNNSVLSIQLDLDGFSFYVTHKESLNKPLSFISKRFEIPGIISLIRELNDFREFDKEIFYKTIIIYHSDKFCLIPDEFYNPDSQGYYLKLSHPMPDNVRIHSFDIQAIKAKDVFFLPEELNSLINLKFPSAILLHCACPAIHYGIQKSEKACIINYYGTSISIAVFDRQELKLFNIFSVIDENDLIYYIFNSLKSCNQKVADTNFYFSGLREDDSKECIALSRYLPNPVFYNPLLQEVNTTDFPVNKLFNHLEAFYCA